MPLTSDEKAILRRIVTGGHPSPGSGYLGWPQDDRALIEERLAGALIVERMESEREIWLQHLKTQEDTSRG